MRMVYSFNLEERLENKVDENMDRIPKLLQNPNEKIPKGDDVA